MGMTAEERAGRILDWLAEQGHAMPVVTARKLQAQAAAAIRSAEREAHNAAIEAASKQTTNFRVRDAILALKLPEEQA